METDAQTVVSVAQIAPFSLVHGPSFVRPLLLHHCQKMGVEIARIRRTLLLGRPVQYSDCLMVLIVADA